MTHDDAKTLLLDKNWQPVRVISWESAIRLLVTEKAHTVTEYPGIKVRSETKAFSIPAVMRTESTSLYNGRKIACTSGNIFLRDKKTCAYCGIKWRKSELTVDHVVPLVQGGLWEWKNLITACRPCNQRKGGRTPTQAKLDLLYKPKEPGWSLLFTIKLSKTDPISFWSDYLYGIDFVFNE
jgi:5-methylcytosine-specific restriction endonuclease McrA